MKLVNGRIYTMNKPGEMSNSIRLDGDRIAALGESGSGIDLGGRTVLPGFCDAHTHFYYWARTLENVDLDGLTSLDAALSKIEEGARKSKAPWIRGRGFNKNLWNPAAFPTRRELDRVVPDRPAAISSKDAHSMWANSRALALAGITAATADPPGGVIQRDSNGELTGMLFEKADELMLRVIPVPDPERAQGVLDQAAVLAHALGVTSMHDMCDLAAWHAYRSWKSRTLDIVKYIRVETVDYVEREKLKSGDGTIDFTFGGLKLFTDGALGSQTAYMWEPYEGTNQCGVERLTEAQLHEYVEYAAAHQLACAIHAIGDRANSAVIKEAVHHRAGPLRHRIEHAQIVRPQDWEPLAQSGWVASMQPSHLVSDRDTSLRNWGEDRSRYAFPIASLKRVGVPLAFGSDVPIEPVDPLFGIYAACCRRRPGDARGPWEPGERLDRYSAVSAFTRDAAYAAGQECQTGSLAPGMRANLIILDRDLLSVPDEEILQVQILATIHAGLVRYVNREESPDLAETLTAAAV